MDHLKFLSLLESLTRLNSEQLATLQKVMTQSQPTEPHLIQRIEENYTAHPRCAFCHSENIRKFVF